MFYYSDTSIDRIDVYGRREHHNNYWDDVAHLPSWWNFLGNHGTTSPLMNGGRASYEFKQYLLRTDFSGITDEPEGVIRLFGRLVDRDLLEAAIANGDFLTYWSYFDDNTNSDYARIAAEYHDGIDIRNPADVITAAVFGWGRWKGMNAKKEREISQSLMEQHFDHITQYGDLPNENEIIAMHNEAFGNADLPANAWLGNTSVGSPFFDILVDEGTAWVTPASPDVI